MTQHQYSNLHLAGGEKIILYTGCPKKKYPDLVDPSDKNIA